MQVGDTVRYRSTHPDFCEDITLTKIEDDRFYAFFKQAGNKELYTTIDHLTVIKEIPLQKHRIGVK